MSRRYAQRVRALRLDSTGWREYCRPANTFHAQAAPLPYSHSKLLSTIIRMVVKHCYSRSGSHLLLGSDLWNKGPPDTTTPLEMPSARDATTSSSRRVPSRS